MSKILLDRSYRLGDNRRGSGIGVSFPRAGNMSQSGRLADLHLFGQLGIKLGSDFYESYLKDIAAARTGDEAAGLRLQYFEKVFESELVFGFKQRRAFEAEEKASLSPLGSRSIGAGNRIKVEEPEEYRTPYIRDLGRILHSDKICLLSGKTQVWPFPEYNPLVHNRLYHVLKVAQLGESIGRALGLNVDLIWAIGLAHDVGHTPFGHTGEAALNEISMRVLGKEFKHNRNGLRVMMELAKNGQGLNLTLEVLDGILHHWGESDEYQLKPRQDERYDRYLRALRSNGATASLSAEEIIGLLDPSIDMEQPLTYEGCVVRLVDKIAYAPDDLRDAEKTGLFTESGLSEAEKNTLKNIKAVLGETKGDMFETMLKDVIRTSHERGDVIAMSDEVGRAMIELKRFIYRNICKSDPRAEADRRIPLIFQIVYDHLNQEAKLGPQEAIDKIAAMTDSEVENYFKDITSVRRAMQKGFSSFFVR
ncbi:MAG: HD domain-containing protein [bacterium]